MHHTLLLPPTPCEVVFGFVYPVGTNANPVIQAFRDHLKQYNYKTSEFRVSDVLRSLDLDITFDDSSAFEIADALIKAGNLAREKAQEDGILAVMAISKIAEEREEDEQQRPTARTRVAQLVRSLKRPEEVAIFRDVYRSGFYLIGIANNDDSNHNYLEAQKGMTSVETDSLIRRDENEDLSHGQRTRDTFSLADVFIQADESHYPKQVERFIDLVFGHPFVTPSKEEHAMFLAYASAARSAQLGRQVGAAIATPEGDVLAVGMNEVPSPAGGSYWEGDPNDSRDHKQKIDSNAQQRDAIVTSIVESLKEKSPNIIQIPELIHGVLDELNLDRRHANLEAIIERMRKKAPGLLDPVKTKEAVADSDLRQITEYGRAVHGEMDAILTCARLGISIKGKYLFVTTFPCHNCTRHIIASGIKKVYYIEPYPKSKALDLHSDAIRFDDNNVEGDNRIPFVPFVGVGPRRYLDLFSLQLSTGRDIERKDAQNRPNIPLKQDRLPRSQMIPLSFLEREERLQGDFKEIVRKLQGVQTEDEEPKQVSEDSAKPL